MVAFSSVSDSIGSSPSGVERAWTRKDSAFGDSSRRKSSSSALNALTVGSARSGSDEGIWSVAGGL